MGHFRVLGKPVNDPGVLEQNVHVTRGKVVLVCDQDELGRDVGQDLEAEPLAHAGVNKDQIAIPKDTNGIINIWDISTVSANLFTTLVRTCLEWDFVHGWP